MANTKLDYDNLKAVCSEVTAENSMLKKQLEQAKKIVNEMNMTNLFKRLDYLFKVLEFNYAFPDNFEDKCSKEIMEILTVKEENSNNETEQCSSN